MIEVCGVGKRYVKFDDAPTLVGRAMQLTKRTRRSDFWALRSIDLTVDGGSSIGVIGRNGSGKSTLLRMLAGVTAPTEGVVAVHGTVAPLIAVGLGFHHELTGRENVYLNGTILGLSRRDVDRRFDEIVDFAEIGDFIDTPVKFYSSGMFVRLGFAVAVCADPEVLLVDEVLAVGDFAFQMKCYERMAEIQHGGATIVVVSHNLNVVRRICDRTVVLHDGELVHDGDTPAAIALVHELLEQPHDLGDDVDGADASATSSTVRIERLEVVGGGRAYVEAGGDLAVDAELRAVAPVVTAALSFRVLDESGVLVYSERFPLRRPPTEGSTRVVRVVLRAAMPTGSFTCETTVVGPDFLPLGPTREMTFYVAGRSGVRGVADLAARLEDAQDST
jgi:ABC-2 type transport system ATP-binding protein